MWCIEARAKIDIPLGENYEEWTNEQLKAFIKSKMTSCNEFKKAIDWIGNFNYKQAEKECSNSTWIAWFKENVSEKFQLIKAGDKITLTKGKNEKFALWHQGIWDLPEEYIGETIRIILES